MAPLSLHVFEWPLSSLLANLFSIAALCNVRGDAGSYNPLWSNYKGNS